MWKKTLHQYLRNFHFRDKILCEKFYVFCFFPCGLWDPSSPTRDQIQAPCSGSTESQPLDHQGIPEEFFFFYIYLFIYLFGCARS